MKQLRLILFAATLAGLAAACGDNNDSGRSVAALWHQSVEAITHIKAFHFLMTTVLNDGEVFIQEGDLVLPDRLALTSQVRQGSTSLPGVRIVYIGDTMWQQLPTGSWTQSTMPIAIWQRAAFTDGIVLTALGERLRQASAPTDLGVSSLDGIPVRHLRLTTTTPTDSHAPMEVWVDPQTGDLKQLLIPVPSPSAAIIGTVTVRLSQINSPAITIKAPVVKPGSSIWTSTGS